MTTDGAGASRGGGDDFHNEDAFLAREGLGLYVVSDGASDNPAGEVAARVATQALEEFVTRAKEDADGGPVDDTLVDRGMHHALQAVRAAGRAPDRDGMTASVTVLLTDGRRGVIGHHGDSRAYLVRRRRTVQLTADQELARDVPGEDPDVQVFGLDLLAGDTLILCTDGAEDVVEDETIEATAGGLSPRVLASRIASAANRRDPSRDATVVVVRVRDEPGTDRLELSSPLARTSFGHTLAPRTAGGAEEARRRRTS